MKASRRNTNHPSSNSNQRSNINAQKRRSYGDKTIAGSKREVAKLEKSLREQWARMDKAQRLAEELQEEIKQAEGHVAVGRKQTRQRKLS